MTYDIYKYTYGSKFAFVILGDIQVLLTTNTNTYYKAVYNIDTQCVNLMISSICETCSIVDKIDGKKLFNLLFDCLSMNLGYILGNIQNYLKKSDECRVRLRVFLSILMKNELSVHEIKEHLAFLKWDYNVLNADVVIMFETIIYEKLVDESYKRLKNYKAKIIQKYWRKIICDPTHLFCKNRILKEFLEMNDIKVLSVE